jgi:hypothetical protein
MVLCSWGQDVLVIRSDAGSSNPVVGSFAPDAINIMRTGQVKSAEGGTWVEVARPEGGTGWVDDRYLTEYVTRDAFCSDGRVPSLITQVKQAMDGSNGPLLASLVSPKHGVRVNYWRGATPVNYTNASAQGIFADSSSINWGAGPSGTPDVGTFAQIVQPDLAGVLASGYQLSCDDPSYADMFPHPWAYFNIHYYAVVQPATPGNEMDWKVWLLGFEYVDGQPYLFGTVHYIWEP